jgi:hypothetical protein
LIPNLHKWKTIAAIAIMAALASCGGGDDYVLPPRLQSLHVAGGTYVTQNYFVLDITSSELKYVGLRGSTVETDFRGPISAADFERLAALVQSANLTQTLGQLPDGSAPCRVSDTEISITTDKAKHDFVIPGAKSCLANPPFSQLSTLYQELIFKYVFNSAT